MLFFFVLFTSLISLLVFYNFYWKRRHLPPGPIPLPLIGNGIAFQKAKNIFNLFNQWAEKYGPVHTFWFGEDPMVMISDYKLMEELFVKDGDTFAGRPQHSDFDKFLRRGKLLGIIATEEDLWRDQRRFALHVLRDLGVSRNIMQERILDEISDMLSNINSDIKSGSSELLLQDHIDKAVGSIINSVMFGYRFEGDRLPEFYDLKDRMKKMLELFSNPLVLVMQNKTEWFKHIPIASKTYYQFLSCLDRVFEFLQRQIDEHEAEINYDSEPTDFVDAYLRKMKQMNEEGGQHYYSMEQLLITIFDIWFAGQETTTFTLGYAIFFLLHHQEVQQKLQEELDHVIGSGRLVTLEDRPKLPYVAAVINETQRLGNIIAFNVKHTVLKDVEINGYKLEKGTVVVPHISALLWDPKVFPEPEKFKPERFLDSKGQLKKVDELIPFSIGKRQCLGESLARMELYLFVANIFNQYKISKIDGKAPDFTSSRKMSDMLHVPRYECKFQKRY